MPRGTIRVRLFLRFLFGLVALGSGYGLAQTGPLPLRGYLEAHDPSTIIKCKDRYYTFHTGPGILSSSSADKLFWSAGPRVFGTPPAWTTGAVPGFQDTFWAPDILYFNSRYHLYYSVSTWGSQVSAIGLATNPTLDPADPGYLWTDQGIVIESGNGSAYNTIDPGVSWDADGNLWLVFGSYWMGIYLVQLDPATGLRISPDSKTYRLAWNNSIEAACIYQKNGYYYLFVNWGSCCSGVNSTYNVRVGRSAKITGPYLDAKGIDMATGGGTLFMRASGKFTGPGHIGVLAEGESELFSFHYYDANAWSGGHNAYGTAKLGLAPLFWSASGWPYQTNDWSAVYNFHYDARDMNHQHYGLLLNGAKVRNDPAHDRVLSLDGINQHVWLPPGVANGQTVSAVVNWHGGGPWQRIFDFGFDTSKTFMLTPASGEGVLQCDLNTAGSLQRLQWDQPLPSNAWTHVAVTLDGSRGILYVNGLAVATNGSMSQLPFQGSFQTNHLGRSKFVADPYFKGEYARFAVFSRVLSSEELVAPAAEIVEPADGSRYLPGDRIQFSGNASDFMAVPLGASAMTWSVSYINGTATNVIIGPLVGVTNSVFYIPGSGSQASNGCYRITLAVSDGASRQASASVDIFPAAPGTSPHWASYYPFASGGQDASNVFNATLLGGASIRNDSTRGSVLNLSGRSQYAKLPQGAGVAETIGAWIKWNGGAAWQRVFDFGTTDTSSWFYFCPKDATGYPEAALTSDRYAYVRTIESPVPFPIGKWTHVAVVADGRQGILYFDGVAVGVNNSLNLRPSDVSSPNVYIGRSQYSIDSFFNGQIDSLKLNASALRPERIFAPSVRVVQPSPGTTFFGGGSIGMLGQAYDFSESPLPGEDLAWTLAVHTNGQAATVLGPVNGASASYDVPRTGLLSTNVHYQAFLAATDRNGLQAIATTDISPRISDLTLETVPPNLSVLLDDQSLGSGSTVTSVSGAWRTITAPSPQFSEGVDRTFVMWSDGGLQAHQIVVPETNATLTASYVEPTISIGLTSEGLQLSWPAWAQTTALHSTTNLSAPVWLRVTNSATYDPGRVGLTLPVSSSEMFFRLQTP